MDPSLARKGRQIEAEEPTDKATVSFASQVFEFSAEVPGKQSRLLLPLLLIAAIVAAPPLVILSSGAVFPSGLVCVIIVLQLTALLLLQATRPRFT